MHASPLHAACILLQFNANLIFEAANRGAERLTEAEPEHTAIGVVQGQVPGEEVGVLSSTPKDSEVSNIVETTTVSAITTWESSEAEVVGSRAWRGCSIP